MAGELTHDDIKPYLVNPKQHGDEIQSACPICEANNPKGHHLYSSEKDGKLVVHCKHGCDGTEILKAFRRLGATHEDDGTKHIIKEWDFIYRNPNGLEAYCKHRIDYSNAPKSFNIWHKGKNGEKIKGQPKGSIRLYNLDKMASAEPETPLYIVEGEKCADAMQHHGFLATTSSNGGSAVKLTDTDLQCLKKFKHVYLLPDNDTVGQKYADSWPVPVTVIPMTDIWEDCPRKGDVADFFARGGKPEAITNYKPLDADFFKNLTDEELIDPNLLHRIAAIKDKERLNHVLGLAQLQAGKRKMKTVFDKSWKSIAKGSGEPSASPERMTNFKDQPLKLKLPNDYITTKNGISRFVKSGLGERLDVVSRVPVLPTRVLVNIEDDSERLQVSAFQGKDWKEITAKRSIWANQNKIIELADKGLDVDSSISKQLSRFIAETASLNRDVIPVEKSVSHFGFAGKDGAEFVPYSKEITFDSGDEYKTYQKAITDSKGTLDEWLQFVGKLRKNLCVRLMIDASFASVVLEKLPSLPFIVHLWGPTGCGKTVTLRVAASVWGNPDDGQFMRSMNMTLNSLMASAAVLRNLPFCGDEMETIKRYDQNYNQIIMQLCEGINRGRLRSDSTLQPTMTWKNLFLFTGEAPITSDNNGGGAINRVIELEADDRLFGADPKKQQNSTAQEEQEPDGREVTEFVLNHYGLAGKDFVSRLPELLNGPRGIKAYYKDRYSAFQKSTGATDKQAMAMAALGAVDDVLHETYWSKTESSLTTFDLEPFMKTTSDVSAAIRAQAYICNCIDLHLKQFSSDSEGAEHLKDTTGTEYWGRIFNGSVYINKTILEKLLKEEGFSFNAIKKEWAANGFLEKYKNKYATKQSIAGYKGYYIKLHPSENDQSEKTNNE